MTEANSKPRAAKPFAPVIPLLDFSQFELPKFELPKFELPKFDLMGTEAPAAIRGALRWSIPALLTAKARKSLPPSPTYRVCRSLSQSSPTRVRKLFSELQHSARAEYRCWRTVAVPN